MVPPIEGEILIDGLDTSTLDLRVLRSRLAIIPQQPVLFSGTIRTNLDPFSLYTDENIWSALKSVYLGEKIQEMPEKLDTPVSENGKMFSLAERQLFCIARAVLTRTKIVVFDGKGSLLLILRAFCCGRYRN
jgi:ABC-type multidrug transport system fused ATPase/permease subunit